MSYPVTFAGLTTAQMSSLDQMFQITGNLGVIPCTAAGTNLITLTPAAGITPPITAYANFLTFSFVAQNTSTGAVTLQVGALSAIPVYQTTGVQASSGGIASGGLYTIAFNQALNGGTGGWQIVSGPAIASNTVLSSGRNRMVNGGMDIDQRNEGAVVSATARSFITDQTICYFSGSAPNITAQRVALTGLAGFSSATQVNINSGSASVGAQDFLVLAQSAEGINVGDLGFGTSVAQPVSLGVWVNSSVGGQVGVSLRNSAMSRSYVSLVNATAGVWTFCPVANIPGDTAGTWLATAGAVGIKYAVTLMAGTGLQASTTNSWGAGNFVTASGQANVTTTAGATFAITGLSLEPGTVTNSFDRRTYMQELTFCKRYYEKSYAQGTAVSTATAAGCEAWNAPGTQAFFTSTFSVEKATTPNVNFYSTVTGSSGVVRNVSTSNDTNAFTAQEIGVTHFAIGANGAGDGDLYFWQWTADAGVG